MYIHNIYICIYDYMYTDYTRYLDNIQTICMYIYIYNT